MHFLYLIQACRMSFYTLCFCRSFGEWDCSFYPNFTLFGLGGGITTPCSLSTQLYFHWFQFYTSTSPHQRWQFSSPRFLVFLASKHNLLSTLNYQVLTSFLLIILTACFTIHLLNMITSFFFCFFFRLILFFVFHLKTKIFFFILSY